ncbi:NAD-dependent epimerase/dehydratase family protein [Pleomorphomonas oryzae]|uniref:NAD-dependent epimerase/dehydratase family protein n=1 Tax=Pleomorphomonas oryzae TaxID=261934 RepID=UPI0004256312|nr:NAD-dependent epimerase/dehydratase family protein [Pleomorphomonas oryzae]
MSGHVLVLGALGGVGQAVAEEFHRQGWEVSGLVRKGRAGELPDWIWPVEAELQDAEAVAKAVSSPVDVVFDGLNAPYHRWAELAEPLYAAALAIAERLEALHLFPGNVYGFGEGMPDRLTPDLVAAPTSEKGKIRVAIERSFAEAAKAGRVRTCILRAGDFFGPTISGQSWLSAFIATKAAEGLIRSRGPKDVPHAWAYLPDLARAFVQLAEQRDRLGAFEVFHFEGHTASISDIAAAAGLAHQRPMRVRRVPAFVFTLMGLVNPVIRASHEMAYLWRVPHRLVDRRLEAVAGPLAATPLPKALASIQV